MSIIDRLEYTTSEKVAKLFFTITYENEESLKMDLPPSSKNSLIRPVFSIAQKSARKRGLKEFLANYDKKEDHVIISDNIDEEQDDEEDYDDEEQQRPEVLKALHDLQFPIDKLFCKVLKPHQIEGLQFMWERVYVKKQGCLLAHSMGLGKTIQVISLLTTMYQHLRRNPGSNFPTGNRVLILTPLVTLMNWVYEFEKWAVNDAENVIGEVYNMAELKTNKYERMKFLKHWYTHGGITLLNYDQFRASLSTNILNDRDLYYKYLVNPGADVVVLDEAHRIKNSTSLLASHVNKIRTKSRICLTGYPLQNHLLEYYYMINFIAPNLLGSRENFKSYFSTHIEKCYSDSSKISQDQATLKLYVLQLLTGHVTHRRDSSILKVELPPKTEYIVRFKLSPVQHKGYMALIRSASLGSPLAGLLVLRAMCNHPKIFHQLLSRRQEKKRKDDFNRSYANDDDSDFIDDDEINEYVDSAAVAEDAGSYKVIKEVLDADIVEDNEEAAFAKWASIGFEWAAEYFDSADIESWKCSGKISFIADLARECKIIEEKVVLVSHSLACLDYIQHLLPIFGIKTIRLDGSVQAMERQEIIDKFNEDKSIGVMLLSAKAAAIGINITAANRIILVDQDWNPLYDEQSIGRVYRYGQEKPVIVYRLITASTIEERIYKQSVHKRSISRRVIDNKSSLVISKEELVEYYNEPDEKIGLIDLDNSQACLDMDWVSSSVLRQNKDQIVEFRECGDEMEASRDQTVVKMSNKVRTRAKEEALSLIRDWQNGLKMYTP